MHQECPRWGFAGIQIPRDRHDVAVVAEIAREADDLPVMHNEVCVAGMQVESMNVHDGVEGQSTGS